MSQGRMLALIFIVVGLLLGLVSAFADQVGLGAAESGFGWKQLLGLVVGVILAVVGIVLFRQDDTEYDDEEEIDDEEAAPVAEERP